MDDVALIESHALRKQFCTEENTSVLEKVGQLVKIPGTAWATTEQVAKFYQVSEKTVRSIVIRHKKELDSDGYNVLLKKDLGELHLEAHKKLARNIAIFPRRAVLRIGMVLRDSSVAKQVRNYLLNVEEVSTKSDISNDTLNKIATQLTVQAIALGKHAEELDTHANQLTEYSLKSKEHTSQLRQNAEQMIFQSKLIKAMVEEMYDNKYRIQHIETRVDSYDKRIEALERLSENEKKRDEEFISEEQVHFLKERVKSMGESNKIWHKLKQHFGVTRYIFLPKSRFREVLDWLENYQF